MSIDVCYVLFIASSRNRGKFVFGINSFAKPAKATSYN